MNLPNKLTMMRVILVPVFMVFAMNAAKKSGLPGCNWSRRLPIACVASPVGSKRPARPSLTACNQNAQNQNRPCKLRLLQPV